MKRATCKHCDETIEQPGGSWRHVRSLAGRDRCRMPEPKDGTIVHVNADRRREEAENQMIEQLRRMRHERDEAQRMLLTVLVKTGEVKLTSREMTAVKIDGSLFVDRREDVEGSVYLVARRKGEPRVVFDEVVSMSDESADDASLSYDDLKRRLDRAVDEGLLSANVAAAIQTPLHDETIAVIAEETQS